MNNELMKEIDLYKNLPRVERRKQERMLQKKYNDKTIRIKNGKKFQKSEGLTRKTRRILSKNTNLLKEILKIIHKYFPTLTNSFSKLTDIRHQSYTKYKMRTIIMIRLFALICGITTMTGINSKFDTEKAIKNFSKICGQDLKEIPDWQTIQDVIETLNYDEIDSIRREMFKALIRSKMFDKYRYNGYIQILVDATGLSTHDYNLNGNCITKTFKDGKTKYYKYILEAKAVFGNVVISIDSEYYW